MNKHPFIPIFAMSLLLLFLTFSSSTPTKAQDDAGRTTRDALKAAFLADRQPLNSQSRGNQRALSNVSCDGGMADTFPCGNVDLLAYLPLSEIDNGTGAEGNDIWGWTDLTTGREYALMGLTTGTAFVDITDPVNPINLGFMATQTTASSWRDLKVYANHAFVVSEASGHGMQIFDLTHLRDVASPPAVFTPDAVYSGFGSAHNIVIDEDTGYAYGVGTATGDGCNEGLHIVNINDPQNPVGEGCFSADGYTHDAQCVLYRGPDSTYVGKEICLNSNEDTLTIVDVDDKANPVQLSRETYAGEGYTHQGWLTEDQDYFILNDELDEQNNGHNTRTYIWDVSDLDAPELIEIHEHAIPNIDHNLYVVGDTMYMAHYRAGLRIFDIADVANGNINEIGFFDIYPADDNAEFNGAWSNYPYFDSGNVIISGIEQGLFVVRPTSTSADFAIRTDLGQRVEVCGDATLDAPLRLVPLYGYTGNVDVSLVNPPTGFSGALSGAAVAGATTFPLTGAGATAGDYTLHLQATDGVETRSTYLKVTYAAGTPAAPVTMLPADGGVVQSTLPQFIWDASPTASSYRLQVATDSEFNNLVADISELTTTSYTLPNALAENAVYFWRVLANNACTSAQSRDSAAVSDIKAFATGALSCVTEDSTGTLPTPISSLLPPTTSSTDIAGIAGPVADVNVVDLTGLHPNTGDLTFSLRSPSGTTVDIMSAVCGSNDNWDLSLDDSATTAIPCPATDGGTHRPSQSLAGFAGDTANGTWTLEISDDGLANVGLLTGWGLEVCEVVGDPADYSDLTAVLGVASHTGDGTLKIGSAWDVDDSFSAGQDDDTDDGIAGIDGLSADSSSLLIVTTSGDGWLSAWFDWNGNDLFEAGEMAFNGAVVSGDNDVAITVPSDPAANVAYRFRLYDSVTDPGATAAGEVAGGEVTDGIVNLAVPLALTLNSAEITPATNSLQWIAGLLILSVTGGLLLSRRASKRTN